MATHRHRTMKKSGPIPSPFETPGGIARTAARKRAGLPQTVTHTQLRGVTSSTATCSECGVCGSGAEREPCRQEGCCTRVARRNTRGDPRGLMGWPPRPTSHPHLTPTECLTAVGPLPALRTTNLWNVVPQGARENVTDKCTRDSVTNGARA